MEYLLHVLLVAGGIYALLGLSLEVQAGQAGQLSVAHATFFAIGAYASAIGSVRLGLGFLPGVALGVGVALLVSLLVAVLLTRLSGDYFVMGTFVLQIIAFNLLNNWSSLTRGPLGIAGVPYPEILGWRADTRLAQLLMVLPIVAVTHWLLGRMIRSGFGRTLHVIREDELLAESLGKSTHCVKVKVFMLSAMLAAIAGSLFAHIYSFVDPTSFTVAESILILSIIIVGGAGSQSGALLGALLLIGVPEILRFVALPSAVAANVRQLLYGSLLVAVVLLRPQGLVGHYRFDR